MSAEALTLNQAGQTRFTAAAALASGEIIQLADGRAAVVAGLKGFASGEIAEALTLGAFSVLSASATTFSAGAPVYWDASASVAITSPGAVDDLYLGTARKAKTSGQTRVDVDLNVGNAGAGSTGQRGVFVSRTVEIDHADTVEFDMIAAEENPNGLLVIAFAGTVTEAPAGATEDQLGITLYDEDDNALSVITTSATPDAVGDVVLGTRTVANGATGDVACVIPAGKSAYAKVSQATAGTGLAGKVKVRAIVAPLI